MHGDTVETMVVCDFDGLWDWIWAAAAVRDGGEKRQEVSAWTLM
jgi:hypothetical protein